MQIALRLSSLLFVTDFTVKQKALRFLCEFGVSEAFQNKDMRALFSDFSEALTKVLQRYYLEENPDEKIEKKLIESFSAVIQKYPRCFIQDNQRILTLIPRMLNNIRVPYIRETALTFLKTALSLLSIQKKSSFFSLIRGILSAAITKTSEIMGLEADSSPKRWVEVQEEALYISIQTYCEGNPELMTQIDEMAKNLLNRSNSEETLQGLFLAKALSYLVDDEKRAWYLTKGFELARNGHLEVQACSYSLLETIIAQKPMKSLKDYFKPAVGFCMSGLKNSKETFAFKALKILSILFKDELSKEIPDSDRMSAVSVITKKWKIAISKLKKDSLICFEALSGILSGFSERKTDIIATVLNSLRAFQKADNSLDFVSRLKIFDYLLEVLSIAAPEQKAKYGETVISHLGLVTERSFLENENDSDPLSENLKHLEKAVYIALLWSKSISM